MSQQINRVVYSSNAPLKAIALFLLMAPFQGTIYLRDNILGINGLKYENILVIIIILISIYNYGKSNRIEKGIYYLCLALIICFTISVLRSLKYLDIINISSLTTEKLSVTRYLLSFYVRPLIYIVPFVVILKYARTENDLHFIMRTVYLSTIIFSVHILYSYLFNIRNNFNVNEVTRFYDMNYGYHRNQMATYFIVGFPIALGWCVKSRNISSVVSLAIITSAIGVVFSRAAYVTTVLAMLMYWMISKRNLLVPIIAAIFMFAALVFGNVVIERASQGIENRDIDAISAGRVDRIWLPLAEEVKNSPTKILFGTGRYAILASDAYSRGLILTDIAHPHNMYFEMIIDAGLIGLTLFISFYYRIIRQTITSIYLIKDVRIKGYLQTILVAIICFLISGITDRSLFPKFEDVFLWTVFGVAVIAANIVADTESSMISKSSGHRLTLRETKNLIQAQGGVMPKTRIERKF